MRKLGAIALDRFGNLVVPGNSLCIVSLFLLYFDDSDIVVSTGPYIALGMPTIKLT